MNIRVILLLAIAAVFPMACFGEDVEYPAWRR